MSTERKFKKVLGGSDADAGKGGNVKFIRPKQLAEEGVTGVVAEGIYQGTTPNNFDDAKNDFKVLAEDGTLLILNSTGSLANQLAAVEEGSYVRISYQGMQAMKKGRMAGKQAHSFIVEVAT